MIVEELVELGAYIQVNAESKSHWKSGFREIHYLMKLIKKIWLRRYGRPIFQ